MTRRLRYPGVLTDVRRPFAVADGFEVLDRPGAMRWRGLWRRQQHSGAIKLMVFDPHSANEGCCLRLAVDIDAVYSGRGVMASPPLRTKAARGRDGRGLESGARSPMRPPLAAGVVAKLPRGTMKMTWLASDALAKACRRIASADPVLPGMTRPAKLSRGYRHVAGIEMTSLFQMGVDLRAA